MTKQILNRRILVFGVLFFTGFLTRYLLLSRSSLPSVLENRIEISTPLSSWKRAIEGVSLERKGINPYDGDIFHETPLALVIYGSISSLGSSYVALIFIVCDLATAAALALSSSFYLKDFTGREVYFWKTGGFQKNAISLLVTQERTKSVPFYIASIYLFCPFSCCGKSTVVFLNLLISLFILLTSAGRWFEASVFLGIVSYQSLHHISLLVPLIMFINQKYSSQKNIIGNFTRTVIIIFTFMTAVCFLLFVSYKKTGSWDFLLATYGFTLSVPDLTPNIGLFWYFFTEMFEHFRVFFLWTFQLNTFIYTIPLAIRLRREPMLLLFIHLVLISLFKPYPCIGDVVLYLAFLPVWRHLFMFMRQSFLVGCAFISCCFLAPTLWHLWIYSGSANANFYFAITLVFNTAQIFLLTDVLSAFVKREYYLLNGIKADENGNLLVLRLQ